MKDDTIYCVDCSIKATSKCEVCKRVVCKDCVSQNHKRNNFENTEPDKIICAYCAEVYWVGY